VHAKQPREEAEARGEGEPGRERVVESGYLRAVALRAAASAPARSLAHLLSLAATRTHLSRRRLRPTPSGPRRHRGGLEARVLLGRGAAPVERNHVLLRDARLAHRALALARALKPLEQARPAARIRAAPFSARSLD
jgi:hypothetical protein